MMRALVIENSTVLRRLFRVTLADPRLEVLEHPLTRVIHDPGALPDVDLALIGTYAPFASALGIIDELAQRSRPPAIMALMTDPRDYCQNEILDAGADIVITMPFSPEALRRAAYSTVRQRGRR
jgi:DNA-binding response OmpR family regulator